MFKLRRWLHLGLMRLQGKDLETFYPYGVKIRLPRGRDRSIRYILATGQPYEEGEALGVQSLIKPGQPVLELGGSIGVISALVRRQIGPEARQLIVEADPRLAQVCAENAMRGVAPGRTEIVQCAIDYSGAASARFAVGRNAHKGSLAGAQQQAVEVPALRLAQLAEKMPPGEFALVSDIEGAELEMFRADRAVLARVSALVLETHPARYPGGDSDLAEMLRIIADSGLRQVRQIGDVFWFQR